MRYKVELKQTDEGYSVWVPGLPGCWSQGQTEGEALENIKDAIKAYLETVDELSKDKEKESLLSQEQIQLMPLQWLES
ncbi:MAG: type II toxin-antitoxin system HicB family antitoxin [Nitrospirae bacterium]|nr:type II toxin-antitoxin system HicB family antitoxin [Nitrospirota bacterium]